MREESGGGCHRYRNPEEPLEKCEEDEKVQCAENRRNDIQQNTERGEKDAHLPFEQTCRLGWYSGPNW